MPARTRVHARVGWVLAATVVSATVAVAAPAQAHSTSNAGKNLRSELIAAPAGVEVQVTSDGSQITVRTEHQVVVTGYQDEPFLRFNADQVFTNANSLTTYDVASGVLETIPTEAGSGEPTWTPVTSTSGWYPWADHRIAWTGEELPDAVMNDPGEEYQVATWTIPITVDGVAAEISGRVLWTGAEGSQGLTIVVCLGLVAVVLVGAVRMALPRGPRSRRPEAQ